MMSCINVSTTEGVSTSHAYVVSLPGFVLLRSPSQEFFDLPLMSILVLITHTLLTLVFPLKLLGI